MEKLLNELYKTFPCVNKTNISKNIGSSTYGEITKSGTEKLLEVFHDYFNSNTIFCDIGSGSGKMVLHIGLVTNIKKSIGIELSKERYNQSVNLKEKYAPNAKHIEFHNNKFQSMDLKDVTVVYVDNTAFQPPVNNQLYHAIPKGCLLLYKRSIPDAFKNEEIFSHAKLIERTYSQPSLSWFVKK